MDASCQMNQNIEMEKSGGEIMKKKVVSLFAVMALTIGTLAGCGSNTAGSSTASSTVSSETVGSSVEASDASNTGDVDTSGIKAGFIFLHDRILLF